MKFGRIAWIILGVGIFAIAFGAMYALYTRQADEQKQLNTSIEQATATLPKLTTQKKDLDSQLAQLQSQLTSLQAELMQAKSALDKAAESAPTSAESIEYDERLFKIASDWNLVITEIVASEPNEAKVEGITFDVTTFVVQLQGQAIESAFEDTDDYKEYIYRTVEDMLSYINVLINDKDFASASIELVGINVPVPLTNEELEEQGVDVERPTISIQLNIYSYKGR
jgi:cell division protein FtsB